MSIYHLQTGYVRANMDNYTLDWSQQPYPFKLYLHRDILALPKPRIPSADFFGLMHTWPLRESGPAGRVEAGDVAAAFLMSAGITARGQVGLRAPASAGALYPAELYALCCQVDGLADGLYHFAPDRPGMHLLREGPLARVVSGFIGEGPAQLTFVISALLWRSIWKYRTRALRYCLLDAGHLLANLELTLGAMGLGGRTALDFADKSLNTFMGLGGQDEVALIAVTAGAAPGDAGPEKPPLPPFDLQHKPLSTRVGRDSMILEALELTGLDAPRGPRQWLSTDPPPDALALPEPAAPQLDEPSTLLQAIRTRRSRRNFLPLELGLDTVAALLGAALPVQGPCRASVFLAPGPDHDEGVYRYYPESHSLELLEMGTRNRQALGQACLGQRWTGQASLSVLLWADLNSLEELGGPRTYRHAMIEAGRIGQRLYLAANALGMGCCGVGAFFDDELAGAARLPQGGVPLYLLSAGPIKRPTR